MHRMTKPAILGDWGNSNLRLFRAGEGCTQVRRGRGLLQLEPDEREDELFSVAGDWLEEGGRETILLSGAAGSNIGLFDAGYLPCPTAPGDLADHLRVQTIRARSIFVVPGLACQNSLGEPNTMRGEETQILGWLTAKPGLRGPHVLCLPGTHTKWVRVENDCVQDFTTALTGEVFHLLSEGSILTRGADGAFNDEAFEAGAALIEKHGARHLLNLLFTIRARQIAGDFDLAHARAHLSGLLVAADIEAAVEFLPRGVPVCVIGDGRLSSLYASLLRQRGIEPEVMDGDQAVRLGLDEIASRLKTP
jgi:2-dehydro-3-deoxygalactonokinase